MKSNILTIYGINQRLSQMGKDFCWLDMPILWELGYESVAVSLFIAKKKNWHKSQHILTLTEVLKQNQFVKINCAYAGGKKDKKINRA